MPRSRTLLSCFAACLLPALPQIAQSPPAAAQADARSRPRRHAQRRHARRQLHRHGPATPINSPTTNTRLAREVGRSSTATTGSSQFAFSIPTRTSRSRSRCRSNGPATRRSSSSTTSVCRAWAPSPPASCSSTTTTPATGSTAKKAATSSAASIRQSRRRRCETAHRQVASLRHHEARSRHQRQHRRCHELHPLRPCPIVAPSKLAARSVGQHVHRRSRHLCLLLVDGARGRRAGTWRRWRSARRPPHRNRHARQRFRSDDRRLVPPRRQPAAAPSSSLTPFAVRA